MEKQLREAASAAGYRLVQERDSSWTLINCRRNAVMFHFQGVTLEEIAAFFG